LDYGLTVTSSYAATFNMPENTVTLVGNVVVTRGSNVLRGQRLAVDLTSGVSKMDEGRIDGKFQSVRRNPPDPRNTAENGYDPPPFKWSDLRYVLDITRKPFSGHPSPTILYTRHAGAA
jgi:hypothetical protein